MRNNLQGREKSSPCVTPDLIIDRSRILARLSATLCNVGHPNFCASRVLEESGSRKPAVIMIVTKYKGKEQESRESDTQIQGELRGVTRGGRADRVARRKWMG